MLKKIPLAIPTLQATSWNKYVLQVTWSGLILLFALLPATANPELGRGTSSTL